jgi:beta-lactamase superfamily II metal-dependent hydrolase
MHRYDVKRIILTLIVGMILTMFPAALAAQNLEIHYINVQQGGCTLIIGPDGTTILYDGGYELKGANEIIPYLQGLGITTAQALDYVIAGHRDTDHYRGLTEVMNGGYDALNVVDNGSDKYNTYWQAFLDAAAGTSAGGVVPMTLGQVINLGSGAKATVVAMNGSVLSVGPVPSGTNNENDRAICLLIEYGDFDFLLTGDMGGGSDDNSCTGRSTSQINMESPTVMAMMPAGANHLLGPYGVEVAHVAHHGSESSTNADYMNLLTPSVACISVGDGQSTNWYHPRIDVVENVLLAGAACITADPALVLQTEEGNPTGSRTSFAGYAVGDIVITTNGVNSYTVNATGAVSQGPDERAAAGLPLTFYFDEYLAVDTPPILYDIHDENLGDTSVDVLWTSNEQADSEVKYGTASGSYSGTVSDASLSMSHSLSINGLTKATTYYYVVESTDGTANTTVSQEYSFTTTGVPAPKVVFSEIFYDTPGTDSIEEWMELYNNSDLTVDISGWTITDNNGGGGTYTIPSGTTMKPNSYLTIAKDSAGFNALYGYDADIYGGFPGLNNSGDAVLLKDTEDGLVDTAAWEGGASLGVPDGWGSTSAPNASTGKTIVRTDVTVDTDTFNDWSIALNNGNPQTQGGVPGDSVLFSEIFYDTPGVESNEEWIELYNNSPADVDLGGWAIVDNNTAGYTYTFPSGTIIKTGTYLTVARNSGGFVALYGYEADVYANLPYLNNGGDTLHLYDGSNNEIDFVAWEGGASAGIPDGWGSTSNPWAGPGNTIVRTDPAVDTDTYADWGYATNNGDPQTQGGGVVIPKVVFSEIFYDTLGTESKEEWLELYNNHVADVDLSGWKIVDNNLAGYTWTFPAGTIIKKGTYLTVGRNSEGFVAMYGYEADLYGNLPYLNNSGETIHLLDASDNVIDFAAWEGGASAGIPDGWGSTSNPWASAGNTIVRADVTVDTDTYSDWTYATDGGNPQTQIVPGNILFSEVFYDTPGTESIEEWLELYNNSTFAVDISGWTITDNNGTGWTFTFPAGSTLEPGTFLTAAMNSGGFTALYGYEADVYGSLPYLNNGGDTLILYDSNGNVKDFVAWEGGASQGIPDGWGSTSQPQAYGGNSIERIDYTVDTDTYNDWTYAPNNGDPWTQAMGVPDTTPPVISNVAAGNITIDGAVITWTTDEPADSVVEYGTEPGNYVDTLSDGALVTEHSIAITGLTHATTYYFRVLSTDESGNTAASDEYSFTTLDIMTNTLTLVDYKHTNDVYGDATITVTAGGVPVAGAVVDITWSGGYVSGTAQGATDANGVVFFRSDRVHPDKWAFDITIDGITKPGYWWDSANSVVFAHINKHKNKED